MCILTCVCVCVCVYRSELHLSVSLWDHTGFLYSQDVSGMRSDHGTENSTIESCQMAFSHLVITMLGSSIRNCVS